MKLARHPSVPAAIGLPPDRRGVGGATGAFYAAWAAAVGALVLASPARGDTGPGSGAKPAPGADGTPQVAAEAGADAGDAGAVGEEVIVVTGTRSETPRAASPV